MSRVVVAVSLTLLLAGCAAVPPDFNREPHMSPVGSGLQANVDPNGAYNFPAPLRTSPQSLWDDNRANFFRDPRAMQPGAMWLDRNEVANAALPKPISRLLTGLS